MADKGVSVRVLQKEAATRAKAEKFHTLSCNENPKNYSVKCEERGDVLFKCVSDLKNPRSKIAESIDLCSSQIQIRN